MFNLRWSDSPPGRCIFSGFSRLEGKDQRHVEEQSESSPVLESFGGHGRRGACHRGNAVDGTGQRTNDTIRVAVAGLNGRGESHVDEYVKMPGVALLTRPYRAPFVVPERMA